MSQRLPAFFIVSTALAVTITACSSQSPSGPGVISTSGGSLDAKGSQGVPGVYALSFFAWAGGTYQEVSSLTVLSQNLILKAQVTDDAGSPAQEGTVTFEYCSYLKRPPNDITRADEAPKEACDQGLAKWARLLSIAVADQSCRNLGPGSACMGFGIVRIPRTVGFRFRYAQQKGSIASGTSEARNFIWVPGS